MRIVCFVHSIVSDWNHGHALETIRRRHHCRLRAEQFDNICEAMMAQAG